MPAMMPETSAHLECQCGRCRLGLCDPNMRYRLECLCFDCRQRGLQFASRRPENHLAPEIIHYERGVDDYYFANAFLVDETSRDLLGFSKLREDAFNTTATARCCGTLMCGTHPVYEGQSVSVNADSCRAHVPQVMSSRALFFGCDCPAEKYRTILEQRDIPVLFSVYDEIDHPEMVAFLEAATAPLADEFKLQGYVTFEQLCAAKTIEIDNSFFDESRRDLSL